MVCEIAKDEAAVGHLPMEISRVTKITLNSRRHIDSLQGYSGNSWNSYKFVDNGEIYPICAETVHGT